jgi:hypothetical protein
MPRWDPAVSHRGAEADQFLQEYFRSSDRVALLIGGAGFDPRATTICHQLCETASGRVRGFFIREERPRSDPRLLEHAEENIRLLRGLVEGYSDHRIDIISEDGAVVGGHSIGPLLRNHCDFTGVTDLVVDVSALSKGISFPLVRGLLEGAIIPGTVPFHRPNIHIMVLNEPRTDFEIVGEASDRVEVIQGFQGLLDHDEARSAARLWMPQLTRERGTLEVLRRIYRRVAPHAVCPILPFPAHDPRHPDELIEFHIQAIQSEWQVDARDIVYADEHSPLDLYRTILRIADARRPVFEQVGGSLSILSPIGSKALAIGAMMAAIERNFPVVYVESMGYSVDWDRVHLQGERAGEIVHVWLDGDVYTQSEDRLR